MKCGRSASSIVSVLPAPDLLGRTPEYAFRSEGWRLAMCRLYRIILKLHQKQLQPIQREFGDRFVQTEFHRHATANERYGIGFYSSWLNYCYELERGVTDRPLSRKEKQLLTPEQQEKMTQIQAEVVKMRVESGEGGSLIPPTV
jgi:hypothetical protein